MHNFSQDDGHAIKLARAAAICEEVSKKYEDRDWMTIKGDDMWMRVHSLIADSVEAPGTTWVRNAGLDEAWDVSNDFDLRVSVCVIYVHTDIQGRKSLTSPSCDLASKS